jgi:hypothetical protein
MPKSVPTSKCYYHRHLEVSKLKKRRLYTIFFSTLCFLLSHLAHSDEDHDDQERWTFKILHTDRWLPTLAAMFLFISLLLVSSFFESRDEIPFKRVDLSHPEISNVRMWIERTIKQCFFHDFKIVPTFIFFKGNIVLEKSLFDFLNQIKSYVCCIHANASWCFLSAKGFKNALGAVQILSRIFWTFLEIFLILPWAYSIH